MLRPEHTLFTYLHLAPDPELTRGLVESGATCVAYETVTDAEGRLPLLAPMSEVAGKIATQAGAFFLERPLGGRGVLLGGVPGVPAANVMVIGGGVVGFNAAAIAIGMEADVFVFDRNIDRLRELDIYFAGRASTVHSSTLSIEEMLPRVDLVIGAVLVQGARAPYVIKRDQLKLMRERAVLVDVAIDQGGCFETSPPDHALRPHLRGRRRDPLLRGQHARRGAGHLHLRADQRHPALRPRSGRRGAAGGDRERSRPQAGRERGRRPRDPSRRGRGHRDRLHPTGRSARGGRMATTVTKLQNFIDGEPADAADGATETVVNPATAEPLAEAPLSSAEDVDRAVKAAGRAFQSWGVTTPKDRSLAMLKLADLVEEHAEELADIESADAGKPRAAFLEDEIPAAADNLRFFASACRNMEGKAAGEYLEGYTSMIRREPIGVVGQITPWNYPLLMASGRSARRCPPVTRWCSSPPRPPRCRRSSWPSWPPSASPRACSTWSAATAIPPARRW